MRRTVLALALALALAVAVVACGGEATDGGETTPAATPAENVTPTGTAPPAESETPTGPATDEGADLYAQNCTACHGADGGGESAPAIAGEDNVDRIREQIREGGDGMPSFSGALTPGQIDALAQYVAGGLQ